MTEFRRLLEDPAEDALALALLRSAEQDSPDPKSLFGAAAALGVGAAFASAAATSTNALAAASVGVKTAAASTGAGAFTTAAAPVASVPLVALLLKPLALGLVTGLAAMGGLSYVADDGGAPRPTPVAISANRAALPPLAREPERARVPASVAADAAQDSDSVADAIANVEAPRNTQALRAPPRAESPSLRAPEAPPVLTEPPSQPTAAFAVEPAAPPPATPAPIVKAPAPASELTRQLAREVALLDRARGALGARDAAGALRALDEYSSERRSGNFDPEATVLRIRALVDLGDRTTAARLAKGFVAKHPESQHAAWLRALYQ